MRHTFSLRQIEGFLLAGELRSFSRGAEAMHISQSAFSQLIRELESNLGVRLFDRTTRRVSLTSAGEAMYRKMGRGMEAIDEACDEARAITRIERGHLSLGTVSSLATGLVTRALGSLRRDFPGISVTLQEGSTSELMSRVAKGELDLAVCAASENAPSLSFYPLFDDELAVVAPADHRHAGAEMLSWAALNGESLVMALPNSSIHDMVSAAMLANNVTLNAEYEAATLFTSLSMVRNGFGLKFMPRIIKDDVNMDGLVMLRIEDPPTRTVGVYRQSERTASPSALKFQELLRSEVHDAQRRMQQAPAK